MQNAKNRKILSFMKIILLSVSFMKNLIDTKHLRQNLENYVINLRIQNFVNKSKLNLHCGRRYHHTVI